MLNTKLFSLFLIFVGVVIIVVVVPTELIRWWWWSILGLGVTNCISLFRYLCDDKFCRIKNKIVKQWELFSTLHNSQLNNQISWETYSHQFGLVSQISTISKVKSGGKLWNKPWLWGIILWRLSNSWQCHKHIKDIKIGNFCEVDIMMSCFLGSMLPQ